MRLIDADALIEHLQKDPLFPLVEKYGLTGVIETRPTIDPVKHGRWIREWDMRGNISDVVWSCSLCGKPKQWYTTNYCPNCGAKMDREEQ